MLRGIGGIDILWSLSGKLPFMLRQTQHEREKANVFNAYSVHPELVEGRMRVCGTGSILAVMHLHRDPDYWKRRNGSRGAADEEIEIREV